MTKAIEPEVQKGDHFSIFHTTWIYQVLKFLGFTVYRGDKSRRGFVYLRRLFGTSSIFLHLCFTYSVAIIVRHEHVISTKHCLTNLICLSLSLSLWHYIQIKVKKFNCFFAKMKEIHGRLKDDSKNEKNITNGIIIMAFMSLVIISAATSSAMGCNVEEKYVSFWLLGYELVDYKILRTVLIFFAMVVFFSAKFLIPALSATVYGVICYKLSSAIRIQNFKVEANLKSEKFFSETRVYHSVIRCCESFEDTAKGLLSLIFSAYFTAIYTGLEMIMGQAKVIPAPAADIDAILTILSCGFAIVCLMVLGSGIPEAMATARSRFQNMYRNALTDTNGNGGIHPKQLVVLKALGKIKPLHLTASKMLKIDKGLILTSFGCALTYCLLIRQLEKN